MSTETSYGGVVVRGDEVVVIVPRGRRRVLGLPKGGMNHGETPQQTAARELREEAGLDIAPEELGEPVWHQVTTFSFDGYWYRQDQEFFLHRVSAPAFEVSIAGHDEVERGSISGFRWWSVPELLATTEAFYPVELPALLRELLER